MKLEWHCEFGETNGVRHTFHIAQFNDGIHCSTIGTKIYPIILQASDREGVTLMINSFAFTCKDVETAKEEAIERLSNNRGIYLRYI